MKQVSKTSLLFGVVTTVLGVILLGAFGSAEGSSVAEAVSGSRRYFSDEIVLFGEDSARAPFALQLFISRREEGSQFSHFYDAVLFSSKGNAALTFSEQIRSAEIVPRSFLKSISIQPATDLSPRETISALLLLHQLSLSFVIHDLHGDFVVRNTLDHAKYASAASGSVTIDGATFPVRAMHVRTLSSDYSKSIFFPNYERLSGTSNALTLWDERGNFIYIDASVVRNYFPEYRSHTWILEKDGITGAARKGYSAEIQTVPDYGIPISWKVRLPEFGQSLTLTRGEPFSLRPNYGIVTGTVTKGGESLRVSGLFRYQEYGGE